MLTKVITLPIEIAGKVKTTPSVDDVKVLPESAAADSGKTFTSSTDGVVFTLPAISIGRVITFVNTAQDGTNALTISPNANDGILYAGSLTDNKDLINTKATSKVGDFVVLASLNSTAHWTVVDAQGVFAKEA